MNIAKSVDTGGGGRRGADRALAQLAAATQEEIVVISLEMLNWGGRGAWPSTAASPQITMEIHISNWTHKFQNKTGLDAKANSELYKSKQVNSAGYMYLADPGLCLCLTLVYVSVSP